MSYFPTVAGFVQSVRQRATALAGEKPLVVVEGTTDRRALAPFLTENVHVIPAGGKDRVLAAFDRLDPDVRRGILFVVDCDGEVDPRYKGKPGLVLTAYRDIEADLLFHMNAFSRVADDQLMKATGEPGDARAVARRLMAEASSAAVLLGVVLREGRQQGAPVRLIDSESGRRRKIRVSDLQGICSGDTWDLAGATRMAAACALALGWPPETRDCVGSAAASRLVPYCGSHHRSRCPECLVRAFGNGHHLVGFLHGLLWARAEVHVSEDSLEALIRVGADKGLLPTWPVIRRARDWEGTMGLPIFPDA